MIRRHLDGIAEWARSRRHQTPSLKLGQNLFWDIRNVAAKMNRASFEEQSTKRPVPLGNQGDAPRSEPDAGSGGGAARTAAVLRRQVRVWRGGGWTSWSSSRSRRPSSSIPLHSWRGSPESRGPGGTVLCRWTAPDRSAELAGLSSDAEPARRRIGRGPASGTLAAGWRPGDGPVSQAARRPLYWRAWSNRRDRSPKLPAGGRSPTCLPKPQAGSLLPTTNWWRSGAKSGRRSKTAGSTATSWTSGSASAPAPSPSRPDRSRTSTTSAAGSPNSSSPRASRGSGGRTASPAASTTTPCGVCSKTRRRRSRSSSTWRRAERR